MEIVLSLQIEALDESGYVATCDDLPGLVAQGRTIAKTTEIAQDEARKLIESYKEYGDLLPSAVSKFKTKDLKQVNIKMPISAA